MAFKMKAVPEAKVVRQLVELGVQAGGVLVVHTSYRAVRPIEGGPLGLIRALQAALGPTGTLVMPTMTDGKTVFDPASTPTLDMGVTAELFWRQPGVLRSPHPGASFAAAGPHAEYICASQPLSPPHGLDSPVGRVYSLGGQVLLLGVHHSENTTMHLAESMAAVPYGVAYPCVVEEDGEAQEVMIFETDHCCRGFRLMDERLRNHNRQREGQVGYAAARLMAASAVVAVATQWLSEDPLAFLCAAEAGCEECDRARASISEPRNESV